jgi:hypothetical protein
MPPSRSSINAVIITAVVTYIVSTFSHGRVSQIATLPLQESRTATSLPLSMMEVDDIAFAVLTSAKHHQTRVNALLRSWGRRAQIRIIATDKASPRLLAAYPQFAVLPYEGIEQLGKKALAVWGLFCEDESFAGSRELVDDESAPAKKSTRKAKWFVMVDDDTFVVMNNLRSVLAQLDPNKDIYGGYVLNHLPEGPFVGGGGGIVLSRPVMEKLCRRKQDTTSKCSAESTLLAAGDLATHSCVNEELGIGPTHIEGFLPVNVRNLLNETYCKTVWWWPAHLPCRLPRRLVTFHYARHDDLVEIDYWAHEFSSAANSPAVVVTRFKGPSKDQLARVAEARRDLALERDALRKAGVPIQDYRV